MNWQQPARIKLVGWRLLKDALKPLLMLYFMFQKMISYPHLYPQFVFDTPVEEYISYGVGKICGTAEN
jgi:hypothetical protein